MPFTPLPAVPNRNQSEDDFVPAMNNFLAALPLFQTEANDIQDDITSKQAAVSSDTDDASLFAAATAADAAATAADRVQTGLDVAATAADRVQTGLDAAAAAASAIAAALFDPSSYQPIDADLTAIGNIATVGLVARTGAGTAAARNIAAGAGISVVNADGVSGNPTISLGPESVYATSLTGSVALSVANGMLWDITLSGDVTFTDGLSTGQNILLHIDDGTARTITWPTITWIGTNGVAPTLSLTQDTVVLVYKIGSTLYGAVIGYTA